jgi:hypothetical protein
MPSGDFERFRRTVLADPGLQVRLRQVTEPAEFRRRVLELAREHGCIVTEPQFEAELLAARRSWLERWLPFPTPPS